MDNTKWIFGILAIVVCVAVGFFIGKSVYDLPIPPTPDPVVNTDTVYTDTSLVIDVEVIKRKAFDKGYWIGRDVPGDTLYHDVDSLAIYERFKERDEFKSTFTSEQEYFTAKFILYSTIDVRDYLIRKPKFTFQYKQDFNELVYTEYSNGYKLGYKEGRNNISFWKKAEYAAYGALGFFLIKETSDLIRNQ